MVCSIEFVLSGKKSGPAPSVWPGPGNSLCCFSRKNDVVLFDVNGYRTVRVKADAGGLHPIVAEHACGSRAACEKCLHTAPVEEELHLDVGTVRAAGELPLLDIPGPPGCGVPGVRNVQPEQLPAPVIRDRRIVRAAGKELDRKTGGVL